MVSYIQKKAIEEILTLDGLLRLHKMLISNIRDDIAGRFRQGNELQGYILNLNISTHLLTETVAWAASLIMIY